MRSHVIAICSLVTSGLATLLDRTVDDQDPFIIYEPATSWHSSQVQCTECLQPNLSLAAGGTFHDGTGGLLDRARKVETDGHNDSGDDNDNDDDDTNPQIMDNPSPSATINFTGVGAVVFCIVPDGNDGNHIAMSNLTFAIDGAVAGTYVHNPPMRQPVTFLYNQSVFNTTGLPNVNHELVVTASPNSAFLLDYFVFTTVAPEPTSAGNNATTGDNRSIKTQKARLSFGLAVGASVGILSLVTICLCFSIQWRRRRSARRALDRATSLLDSQDVDEGARMHGPAPFVPRYFPGTVHADVMADSDHATAPFVPRYFPETLAELDARVVPEPYSDSAAPITDPDTATVIAPVGAEVLHPLDEPLTPPRPPMNVLSSRPSTQGSLSPPPPFEQVCELRPPTYSDNPTVSEPGQPSFAGSEQ